jgi:hypothetical protein
MAQIVRTRPELAAETCCLRCGCPATQRVGRPVERKREPGRDPSGTASDDNPIAIVVFAIYLVASGIGMVREGGKPLRAALVLASGLLLACVMLLSLLGIPQKVWFVLLAILLAIGGMIVAYAARRPAKPEATPPVDIPVCDRHRSHWAVYARVTAIGIGWAIVYPFLVYLVLSAINANQGNNFDFERIWFVGLLLWIAPLVVCAAIFRTPIRVFDEGPETFRIEGVRT